MLFDHCADCRRCCNVDSGHPPLEVSLTKAETKRFKSICIEDNCEHLGDQGCTLGPKKPFSCTLYPLAYSPKSKEFYFDTDCPLMPKYFRQLKNSQSEASTHLATMQLMIKKLQKTDTLFLKKNHEIDVDYFNLKKIP